MPTPRRRPGRGHSWMTRGPRSLPEEEALLGEEDEVDEEGLYPPQSSWIANGDLSNGPPNPHANLPVYTNIWRIRRDIILIVEDPYSLDQLRSPRFNIQIIRPLVNQFYKLNDISIVYSLMVNKMQFERDQKYRAHHQTVNLTRALVCELIAEKIVRRYNEHNPGPKGLLLLANILVAGFEPFQLAPEEVFQENPNAMQWGRQKDSAPARTLTALELAIISESKSFLSTSACQKVIDAIFTGKLCYTPSSFIDIIPDRYKHRQISLYDPRRGPWLNQYRLIVPRTRNVVEVCQFTILLILYLIVMCKRRPNDDSFGPWELAFMIYALGWVIIASKYSIHPIANLIIVP